MVVSSDFFYCLGGGKMVKQRIVNLNHVVYSEESTEVYVNFQPDHNNDADFVEYNKMRGIRLRFDDNTDVSTANPLKYRDGLVDALNKMTAANNIPLRIYRMTDGSLAPYDREAK